MNDVRDVDDGCVDAEEGSGNEEKSLQMALQKKVTSLFDALVIVVVGGRSDQEQPQSQTFDLKSSHREERWLGLIIAASGCSTRRGPLTQYLVLGSLSIASLYSLA